MGIQHKLQSFGNLHTFTHAHTNTHTCTNILFGQMVWQTRPTKIEWWIHRTQRAHNIKWEQYCAKGGKEKKRKGKKAEKTRYITGKQMKQNSDDEDNNNNCKIILKRYAMKSK